MQEILTTRNLTKTIRGKKLVDDVNINVKKGEIYGFLGPNGAGKTTTIKMITNIWKPTSGEINIFGERLTPKSYSVLKRMSSIIEFPVFYDELSGKENLKLHCEYMGYYSPKCIENALEMLNLTEAADKNTKEYSLGMRQRLGIARAIITKPELLILDEPTNGLDPIGMKQIRDLLKMLSKQYGITIIISSHILSEIESLANTIGIINHGRMIREISMEEVEEKSLAYIELSSSDIKHTSYVLADKLNINNFKIMDNGAIRIYENGISTQEISKALALNNIGIDSLSKHAESLEDYFLKVTEGVK